MALAIGSPSFVAETTRTQGQGAYVLDGNLPRAAKFSEIYAPGDTFDYFADDGGGLAEYGTGILNANNTISRFAIHWSTSGGAAVTWGAGRRTIRAYTAGPATTEAGAAPTISGFWPGTVGSLEKIERYLFVQAAVLPQGMPGSLATCDTPNAPGSGDSIVSDLGDPIVTETGDYFLATSSGTPAEFSITRNTVAVGRMLFEPGALTASFASAVSISFVAGDVLEIIGPETPGDIADIIWSIRLSS